MQNLRRLLSNRDLAPWEGGKWHPFVGAGLGAYFLQHRSGGRSIGPSGTEAGLNVGGGVEYFLTRRLTVEGEAAYHFISQGDKADFKIVRRLSSRRGGNSSGIRQS